MAEHEEGPFEREINEIMRFEMSKVPAMQNAFNAGRSKPIREDLVSDNADDAILEGLEITGAGVEAVREAIRRIAREFDDRASS
jgi:DNA-directed RNA polymerase specialized sigma subunit